MFTFLRSRLRFAGRIGWIDGRRGYPGEDHFVELHLHRPGELTPGAAPVAYPDAGDTARVLPAAVRPLSAGPRG